MHNLELGVGGGRHSLQVQRSATSSLPLLNLISIRRVLEVPPQPGSQPRKGGSCSAWNAAPQCRAPQCPPAAAAAVGGSSSALHVHHLRSCQPGRSSSSSSTAGTGTKPCGAQHGAVALSTRPARQHSPCGGPAKNSTALAQGRNI